MNSDAGDNSSVPSLITAFSSLPSLAVLLQFTLSLPDGHLPDVTFLQLSAEFN